MFGRPAHRWTRRLAAATAGALVLAAPSAALADTSGDQIFTGNVCIGATCLTGEPFTGPGLKLKSADTPALTLEQPAGTYPAQAWDVGGNDENFFVRDQAGPTLPLRIRPRAPTSSIDIAANGNVGIDGTGDAAPALPAAALQVTRSNGTAKLRVQEDSTTVASRVLAELANSGPAQIEFQDTRPGGLAWRVGGASDGSFVLLSPGQAGAALTLRPTGELQAGGLLLQTADAALQTGVRAASTTSVLKALATLPISTYTLANDPAQARHIGPAGDAFRKAFGVGSSDQTVAPSDIASVALAAVQRLAKTPPGSDPRVATTVKNLAKTNTRVTRLESANRSLVKRVSTLEKQVRELLRRGG